MSNQNSIKYNLPAFKYKPKPRGASNMIALTIPSDYDVNLGFAVYIDGVLFDDWIQPSRYSVALNHELFKEKDVEVEIKYASVNH